MKFEKGKGDWEKLVAIMQENDFSTADFLAVICASLAKYKTQHFETRLAVAGYLWKIKIEKEVYDLEVLQNENGN